MVKKIFLILAVCGFAVSTALGEDSGRLFEAVPFNNVHATDGFWAPRIKTNIEVSAAHNIDWCENRTGRIQNFRVAAGAEGDFQGIFFDDSDVYKVIEGLAYTLTEAPNASIEKKTKEWIDLIAAAQQDDGYLMCWYIIREPDRKWTNLANMHELYCAGHMTEAAVAMARATGDEKLLNVNRKLIDLICKRYGPGPDQLRNVPGHPELELALVKLYQYTGDKKYLEKAKFFIDCRGVAEGREKGLYGDYCQDHMPLREQSEVCGHAVRAMYLYAGATDVAGYYQDDELMAAMNRLWDNVTLRKMYITGGIGSDRSNEGFRNEYFLPNATAYCETCAAIGLTFWAHRMNLASGEAKFADVMERALYNGVVSGYALSGNGYFYGNPLASDGTYHRSPFFGCACCPSNVIRMIASMPGYIYATSLSDEGKEAGKTEPDTLVVNLFIEGTATVSLNGRQYTVEQKTEYPYDGVVEIKVKPHETQNASAVRLLVRNPGKGRYLTQDLALAEGQEEAKAAFGFDMTPRRYIANPKVEGNRACVAIQRGPLVYCFEQCDNPDISVDEILLPRDPEFKVEKKKGFVAAQNADDPTAGFASRDTVVITTKTRNRKNVTAIPYCLWDNRTAGKMRVWVSQDGMVPDPDQTTEPWREEDWIGPDGKPLLYRPLEHRFFRKL
ncbi:MAG: glycoside hydrolase family 127 protein [Thermoguttaceae bacterium]